MPNIKDVIIKLKEVRKEKELSYDKILELMKDNGDFVSKSTLSRLFADGSEDKYDSFSYEHTIRPVAKVLLDMETIEDTDDLSTQTIKEILKFKMELIEDLEKQVATLKSELDKEKLQRHEKLDKEREKFQKSLDFCRKQIDFKDERIDHLLSTVDQLLETNTKLQNQFLVCPYRKNTDPQEG